MTSAPLDSAPDSSPVAAHPFSALTPDAVLDALASVGLYGDGRLLALSSYENRVYQAALFVVVPNRDVLWRDALIGGCVTAIVLEIMKSAFAFYLTRFPTYTVIYGAFATLPIFLLWIYLSWLAVLLGATLASSAPLIRLGRWHINRYPGASFVDALDALRALRRAQLSTPGGVAANLLASELRLHQDELNEVLETLSTMGLATRSPEDNWMLTCDARGPPPR